MSNTTEATGTVRAETLPESDFPASLFTIIEHVRGTLTELLSSINADPAVPYALSRRLGINKNLIWKIARIVTGTDPFSVVEHLPGPQGMEILLSALAKQGAPARAINEARAVLAEFDRVVKLHAGDRRALDLILASHDAAPVEPAEQSRRLAFEGNSAVWGLQARVRFASYFVAPSVADDGSVDTAMIGGLVGVRRLRPEVSAPVFRMAAYNDDGSFRGLRRFPLDAACPASDPSMLIGDFCSPDAPPLTPVQHSGALHLMLPRGPVGRTGLASWVYGWRTPRFASIYSDEVNQFGEHATRIFVPAEALLCDLHIHRSLPFTHDVHHFLFSQLAGSYSGAGQPCDLLPVREPLATLGGRPPVVATPLLPHYSEWVRWAFERISCEPRDFVAYRFVMKYPPIPTVLVLRYPLAERPTPADTASGPVQS